MNVLMKPALNPLEKLNNLLLNEMLSLNSVILAHLKSDVPLVSKVIEHILNAGGKQIRPMLTLACQRLFGDLNQDSLRLGASVELIHTATLLHDDVIDGSDLRRGKDTANAIWGNTMGVLGGDFLFSRAFQLMVSVKTPGVLNILADALSLIAEGEVLQLSHSHDINLSSEIYFKIATRKTAVLFDAACRTGGMTLNISNEQLNLLSEYGQNLGLAFQITDDILDYLPLQNYGKTPGEDFFDGKITLPVILARTMLADTKWLSLFDQGVCRSDDDFKKLVQLFCAGGVFNACFDRAFHYAKVARDAIKPMPPSPIRDVLEQLPSYVVTRAIEAFGVISESLGQTIAQSLDVSPIVPQSLSA